LKKIFRRVNLNNKIKDILVENGLITAIEDEIKPTSEQVVNCHEMVIVPTMVNGHTHAAMTLMRGYADDLELFKWLSEHIWPLEKLLTEEDVYWGTRLACLEMIKTGTTCFNDMYWHPDAAIKAIEDSGLRAIVGHTVIDFLDSNNLSQTIGQAEDFFAKHYDSEMIQYALAPHAIYTVSKEALMWISKFSKENNKLVHIHLSETKKEVNDSIIANGRTPVEYLESFGFFDQKSLLAHGVWLNEEEIKTIAKHRATILHNPISNLKLASGFFPYSLLKKNGVRIAIGTDGCSSNNNLSMLEEMKVTSLVTKHIAQDPTVYSAEEVFRDATINGYDALRINSGKIDLGYNADFMLLRKNNFLLTPGFETIPDLVYSADSSSIDTVVCNGNIVMDHGIVKEEQEILNNVKRVVKALINRKRN
jgi:5-methylthioadenosine/S-adenosylhomocysteine deaminase